MTEDAHISASVAGTQVDIGAQRVGVVYAKALLAAAQSSGNVAEVMEELDSLVNDVLLKHPDIDAAMGSGMISNEDKVLMVDRVFGGKVTQTFSNFLKVLSSHGRGGYLRAIQQAAHDLYDEMQGRVRVLLTTATPLDPALAGRIVERLRGATGAEPVLVQVVDPGLIGGIIFRIGDTVYDGSISTQLEQVRSQMINRSVHEIQRRRDRFSHPAGN